MNKISCLFFTILISISCTFAKAEAVNKIVVSAANWEGFTEKDGTGIYFTLLKAIYGEENITFLTSTYPRALNQFKHQKSDVMVGVYQHELPEAFYAKWFLDTDMAVQVFYRVGNNQQKIIKDSFNNKKVAWRAGYGFEKFFPNVISPYKIDNLETGFRLLSIGRIDYLLDYEHNFNKSYESQINYQVIHGGEKLYIAFQDNKKGRKLAHTFDTLMLQLRDSGKLEQIFGEEYPRSGFHEFQVSQQ